MKILKWADAIKENVTSKEDILNKAEKAEIFYHVKMGINSVFLGFGIFVILISPTGTKATWLGLITVIGGFGALIDTSIRSHLKLERYKAIWDKMDQMQNEMRKMQAEDL